MLNVYIHQNFSANKVCVYGQSSCIYSQTSMLSDRVEAINQHVNAFDIDGVVKHLRLVTVSHCTSLLMQC